MTQKSNESALSPSAIDELVKELRELSYPLPAETRTITINRIANKAANIIESIAPLVTALEKIANCEMGATEKDGAIFGNTVEIVLARQALSMFNNALKMNIGQKDVQGVNIAKMEGKDANS